MDHNLRQSGIEILGGIRWGTHFCQFYETSQDLIETIVPYFREGLAANEFCMWITSEPLGVDQATAALKAAVPDLDEYINRGQIEILDYRQWYVRCGRFSADEVLQGWVDKLDAATEKGYEGLRLTGNTFWLEKADWDDFKSYEQKINEVIGRYNMLAICTYSLDKCGASEILDVVVNHQFAMIKRAGQWAIIQSEDHRKIQKALESSEQKYRDLVENVNSIILRYDRCGKITFFNDYAQKFFGYGRDEIIGKDVSIIIPAEESNGRSQETLPQDILENPSDFMQHINENVRRNGERVWISWQNKVILGPDGVVAGNLAVGQDITDQKRMEEALKGAKYRLELAQRYSRAGTWDWNLLDGKIDWSPEMFELFGLDAKSNAASFETWNQVLYPEDREIAYSRIDDALKKHTGLDSDCRIVKPDGEVRWINALGKGVYDEQGRPVRMTGLCIDITERKRNDEKIKRQNIILNSISRIYESAIRCNTLEELGEACLDIAESATGSKFSFIGEIGADGLMHDIAISDMGRELCRMPDKTGHRRPPATSESMAFLGRSLNPASR